MQLVNRIEKGNDHLIIFIHGLTGSKKSFYTKKEEKYFHEYFSSLILDSVDIAYCEYISTSNILKYFNTLASNLPFIGKNFQKIYNEDLDKLTNKLNDLLDEEFNKYKTINFICHSMGGIIAKGILIQNIHRLNKINFYITLATPHRGGNFAFIGSLMNNHAAALRKDSQLLKELDSKYQAVLNNINTQYYRAIWDFVVTKKSSHPTYDTRKFPTSIECFHTKISKPKKDYYLGELIQHINLTIEDFLGLLFSSQSFEKLNLYNNYGYGIIDVISISDIFYILLEKHDKREFLLLNIDTSKDMQDEQYCSVVFTYTDYDNMQMSRILFENNYLFIIGNIVIDNNFSICLIRINKSNPQDYFIKFFEENYKDHRYAMDAVFNSQKQIITVGKSFYDNTTYISKINLNFELDTNFMNNIKDTLKLSDVWLTTIISNDGYFITAGKDSKDNAYIIKYFDNGQIDVNFGNQGIVKVSGFLRVEKLAFQSDNSILVVGVQNEGRVIRLNKDGEFDTTFGTNSGFLDCIANERTETLDILVLENDDFILSGHEYDGNSYQNGLIMYFNKNGKANTNKFDNGLISFTIKNKSVVKSIIIQNNNLYAFTEYNISHSINNRVQTNICKFNLN